MAGAHSLLVQSDWKGADLASMARIQLEPYATDGAERLHIEGPPISLPAELATPFGLVLHELAANAAKYGSLSHRTGRVNVTWTLQNRNNQPLLSVAWTESGGPAVHQPGIRGFGSILIEKGIPGAKVQREFKLEGFTCTIELHLSDGNDEQLAQL
jgi:two-component system, chemotaxis family, CheB/CheR fusion protein